MKSAGAYFLLFFYIVAASKPALPIVKDFMAHMFWKVQHIAAVHHHHGDHHVHHEIADVANENSDNENRSTTTSSEPVSSHVIEQFDFEFNFSFLEKHQYPVGLFPQLSSCLEKPYPPPKFC